MRTNRREFFMASTAAAAAMAMPLPLAGRALAQDAMPADTGQAAAAYRYKSGDIVVTAATEGVNMNPLKDGFVTNASLDEVKAALAEAFLPADIVPIPFTPVVIESGEDLILLDTGFADNGPPTAGMLRANLATVGITPEDITKVLISHFHGDHIQGIRNKAGELVYPNAEIHVPEPEWAFWMDDAKMAAAPERARGGFETVRRVFGPNAADIVRFGWDEEVLPGIQSVDAHGHTPGHTAFVVGSGDERVMMLADTTNHPALFVRNPDWAAVFDMDAEAARQTRHRLLDMAAADRLQVAGYHFPFPATGHIVKDGERYRFHPAMWMPVLDAA
jgi:glyoxylase-like metal-dependent hydrolase (beta-lactamase superfamily II)